MPKKIHRLTALAVDQAKYKELRSEGATSPGALLGNRLSDGHGLYLFVTPAGAKSWRFDYRFPKGGKRHVLVHGSYPDLSLSQARERHAKARLQLADGKNPAEEKKKLVEQSRQQQAKSDNERKDIFQNVAADWLKETLRAKPLSDVWKSNTERWIGYANEEIGTKPLTQIEAADILAVIRKISERGNPTSAEFTRQTISRVFRYGILNLRAPRGYDPAAALRGAIIVPPKKHRPKLTAKELPAFLRAIAAYEGPEQTRLGMLLLVHAFPRKQELAAAPWVEIDLEAALWTIPAARMKMDRDHAIPLSSQVVGYFRRLRELSDGSDYVFPARNKRRNSKPFTGQVFNYAFTSIGYGGDIFTPHGARATAASILSDAGHDKAIIKAQLAHQEKGDTDKAYFRSDYLDRRRELLQVWSNMLDAFQAGAAVIPLRVA